MLDINRTYYYPDIYWYISNSFDFMYTEKHPPVMFIHKFLMEECYFQPNSQVYLSEEVKSKIDKFITIYRLQQQ